MDVSIPELMAAADRGDRSAAETLFAALYTELHRLARRELARNAAATLGATSLLHQAYMDIAARRGADFADRQRFMAYAARVMRGVVIDYVRERQAQKRGGQFELTSLRTDVLSASSDAAQLQQLSDGLDALAVREPALAEVVDLKFFCGFSSAEIAAIQGTSERTVQRSWQKARIFLYRAMQPREARLLDTDDVVA